MKIRMVYGFRTDPSFKKKKKKKKSIIKDSTDEKFVKILLYSTSVTTHIHKEKVPY